MTRIRASETALANEAHAGLVARSSNYSRFRHDGGALVAFAAARFATVDNPGELALFTVTIGLRAAISSHRDHFRGLRAVRRQLAEVGDGLTNDGFAVAGYSGKDLVILTTSDGSRDARRRIRDLERRLLSATLTVQKRGYLMGASCSWISPGREPPLPGLPPSADVFARAYEGSVAAKIARDSYGTTHVVRAEGVGNLITDLTASDPTVVTALFTTPPLRFGPDWTTVSWQQPAARFDMPSWAIRDLRYPSVWSESGFRHRWRSLRSRNDIVVALTDVHDLERGVRLDAELGAEYASRSSGTGGVMSLPVQMLAARSIDYQQFLSLAFRIRCGREMQLNQHLAPFGRKRLDGLPAFFGATGDGLLGFAPDEQSVRQALLDAWLDTAGHLDSGVGTVRLDGHAPLTRVLRAAQFSLHVTKWFKGSGRPNEAAHAYGHPLDSRDSDLLLDRVSTVMARNGSDLARAAVDFLPEWAEHLPAARVRAFKERLMKQGSPNSTSARSTPSD